MERLHGQLSWSHKWNAYPVWQIWCNSILSVQNQIYEERTGRCSGLCQPAHPSPATAWEAQREERKAQLSLTPADLGRMTRSSSWMNESRGWQALLAVCSALPGPSTWEWGLTGSLDNHRVSVVLLWKPNLCPWLGLVQVNPLVWDLGCPLCLALLLKHCLESTWRSPSPLA